MTTYNKATLKTFFQTNDVPDGNDYANLIDSQVNLVETAVQEMAGPLSCTELITARVSATNVALAGDTTFTGSFTGTAINKNIAFNAIPTSAGDLLGLAMVPSIGIRLTAGLITFTVSGGGIGTNGTITCDSLSARNFIAASAMRSNTTVSAVRIHSNEGYISSPVIVSAAGTALATATICSAGVNIVRGVNDGTTTGVGLMANKLGLVQYIINETAVSANLWPCTGGQINALGSGAAFPLAANTQYTVIHTRASGYSVK
jgi:hypothetical protein